MEMTGSRALPMSQQIVWDALNNAEILKACIPGCEKFELTEPNTYAVGTAIKIGPVAARFQGKVTLTDIVAPRSYQLQFDAQGGVAGFGKGSSKVELKPAGSGQGCELHYTVNSTVGGKIAQLGQRLIDGAAKSLAEDFFRRFEEELQKRHPVAAASDTAAAATAPAATGGLPIWVWVAIAAAVALGLVILT